MCQPLSLPSCTVPAVPVKLCCGSDRQVQGRLGYLRYQICVPQGHETNCSSPLLLPFWRLCK